MKAKNFRKIMKWAEETLGLDVVKKLKIKDLKWLREMHAEYTA